MRLSRTIARPLVASVFIVSGLDVLMNTEPRGPVLAKAAAVPPFAPTDPVDAVRLNAAVHLGAGVLLAVGVMPRLAALALAVSMGPTTIAGHPFWQIEDAVNRKRERVQFLKNTATMGGLLVVALD